MVGQFPGAFDVITVTPAEFDRAFDVFEHHRDHPLAFTDATTVALMDAHGIDHLLSFDDDFDGIVERLEPGALYLLAMGDRACTLSLLV